MSLTKHMMDRLDAQNFEWEFSIRNQEKSATEECADKMRKKEQAWPRCNNEALASSIINSTGIQDNDTALYRTISNFDNYYNYYQPSATVKYPYATGDFQVGEETKEPVYHSTTTTSPFVNWSDIAANLENDTRDSYICQHSISHGYAPDLVVNDLCTTQKLGFYPDVNLPAETSTSTMEQDEQQELYAPENVINYLDEVSKRLEFLPLKNEINNLITKIETKLSAEIKEDNPVSQYDGRYEPAENPLVEFEVVSVDGDWRIIDQNTVTDHQRTELGDMPWDQFKHMLDDFSC